MQENILYEACLLWDETTREGMNTVCYSSTVTVRISWQRDHFTLHTINIIHDLKLTTT